MTDWESICSNCGLCCHEKVVTEDFLLIDPTRPCEYYDEATHLCTVYNERFKVNKRCRKVSPLFAATTHSLPPTCAYISYMKEHHLRIAKDRPFVLSSLENLD